MAKQFAITTKDNPFNPFEDMGGWYVYDIMQGYNTCALLGRFARTSDQLTEAENNDIISKAIDDILSIDFEGKYKKLEREADDPILYELPAS